MGRTIGTGENQSGTPEAAIADNTGLVPLSFTLPLKRAATGTQLSFTPGFAGTIKDIIANVVIPGTGSGADIVIVPKIGTVALTGGSMPLVLANATPEGTDVPKSAAITAANVFTATDVINITLTVNTAFTAGTVNYIMMVQSGAIATILATLRAWEIIKR